MDVNSSDTILDIFVWSVFEVAIELKTKDI